MYISKISLTYGNFTPIALQSSGFPSFGQHNDIMFSSLPCSTMSPSPSCSLGVLGHHLVVHHGLVLGTRQTCLAQTSIRGSSPILKHPVSVPWFAAVYDSLPRLCSPLPYTSSRQQKTHLTLSPLLSLLTVLCDKIGRLWLMMGIPAWCLFLSLVAEIWNHQKSVLSPSHSGSLPLCQFLRNPCHSHLMYQ